MNHVYVQYVHLWVCTENTSIMNMYNIFHIQ